MMKPDYSVHLTDLVIPALFYAILHFPLPVVAVSVAVGHYHYLDYHAAVAAAVDTPPTVHVTPPHSYSVPIIVI